VILVRVQFADFEQFYAQFTSAGAELRRRHGSRGARVFRDAADEHRAWLLFDWDRDAFDAFRADPEVQASMRAGGATGPPEAFPLEEIGELEA
jgi:quinol monooxygenase YgiN